mgnify:CR=1 FL=1
MTLPETSQTSTSQTSRFADYLSSHSLPANSASLRRIGDLTVALVAHAPNEGLWFDPIDDVVISVVVHAGRSRVVRNVGRGQVEFSEAPGLVLLSPADRASYWRFEGSPLVLHLSLPHERCPALQESLSRKLDGEFAGLPCRDPLVAQLAGRMWELGSGPDEGARRIIDHGVATLLALLTRRSETSGSSGGQRPSQASGLSPGHMRKVAALMSGQTRPPSVSQLAASVSLSQTHFVRSFKAATGHSPYRMASQRRIEEAKRLLSSGDLSMTDIAFKLGFASSAHFSSRFKELTGMSPTRWRATYSS